MKKLAVTCAILTSFWTISSNAQEVCQLKSQSFEKKFRVSGIPGFFFKVHPSGDYLSYIGDNTNLLLDLKTGISYPSPQRGDPVWSQDGKFLSVIGMDTLNFYKGDEVIEASLHGKPETVVPKEVAIPGVYQSIGKSGDGYKVITDAEGVSLSTLDANATLTAKPKKPCSNIPNLPTDLPMLSKDGKFLSVYDSKSKSTKIYNIEKPNCVLALDLGFPTGKVSFNLDSSQIAFHLDQFVETAESGYFSGISKDKVKNVVVLNLESSSDGQKLTPSTWALASSHSTLGNGGYYPDYDGQNNIYYMEDIENDYGFVKVGPTELEFKNYDKNLVASGDCVTCQQDPKLKSTNILAKMWTDVCLQTQKISLTKEKSLIAAIDPTLCLNMVQEYWTPALDVTQDELKEVCPKKNTHYGQILGTWDENRDFETQGKNLINARCVACHTRPMEVEVERTIKVYTGPDTKKEINTKVKKSIPAFNKDVTDLYTIAKLKISIENGSMPKAGELSGGEHRLMTLYMYRKLMDAPRDALRYSSLANSYYEYEEKFLVIERKEALAKLPAKATAAQKKEVVMEINCTLGRKGCADYINLKTPQFKLAARKLPLEKRKQYIENEVMFIKCEALFETTFDECLKWKIEN